MQMLRALGESDTGLPKVSWSGQVPVVVVGSGSGLQFLLSNRTLL